MPAVDKPGRGRHVGEAAVAVLAIQAVPVGRIPAREIGGQLHGIVQLAAVYQKDVQQPVVVVVEQGHPAAHRLDHILLRGRRVAVSEIESRGLDNSSRALRRADARTRGADDPAQTTYRRLRTCKRNASCTSRGLLYWPLITPKCGIAHAASRIPELHAVEQIEDLGPELQSDPFSDLRVLEHREVVVRDAVRTDIRQRAGQSCRR